LECLDSIEANPTNSGLALLAALAVQKEAGESDAQRAAAIG
jgi:hypothetical protein